MLRLEIDKNNLGNEISPLLYGIFFEDINYGGDGGLYGELLANRAFGYYDQNGEKELHGMCWEKLEDECGIVNTGYNNEGFGVKKGQQYRLTLRSQAFDRTSVIASIIDTSGKSIGSAAISLEASDGFLGYRSTITALETCENARFSLVLPEGGDVEFSFVSLFPADTFMGRTNGMRRDLAEKLKELSPSFMRFPGGCIVEGRSFDTMYNWKDTVGPVHLRRTNVNRWQMAEYQQEGRDSLDYFQSYGLGFFEYFQLCEDLGCEPLPVINCGMTCQWHEALTVPLNELDPFIQDAIDLVEFANGDADTNWGKVRCDMGHEKPFNLKMIGIGNEQWGDTYFERYEAFEGVLKEKCPEIKLITCAGWNSEGKEFDEAYEWMKRNPHRAYAVDEHFYKSPEWFLSNVHRYDDYDRGLPKVFAGEYASHTAENISDRRNNMLAALTEAAFLTGVEKNADHVVMTSYAPLFAKASHQQWQPDLIWFNNLDSFGSPSYYVQKLFGNNVGDRALIINNISELEGAGVFASASIKGDKTIIKLVNTSDVKQDIEINGELAESVVLFISGEKEAENTFDNPQRVCIKQENRSLTPLCLNANEILVLTL